MADSLKTLETKFQRQLISAPGSTSVEGKLSSIVGICLTEVLAEQNRRFEQLLNTITQLQDDNNQSTRWEYRNKVSLPAFIQMLLSVSN